MPRFYLTQNLRADLGHTLFTAVLGPEQPNTKNAEDWLGDWPEEAAP